MNSQPALTLSHRRADRLAFWLVGDVAASLLTALAAAVLRLPSPWAWGAAMAVAVVLPGIFWRPWYETGIRGWNGLARRVAAALRTYVLAVTYYILFSAVGVSGSSLALLKGQPDRSRWLSRAGAVTGHDDGGSGTRSGAERDHGLMNFARSSGHGWATALVPIVFLLRLLKDDEQESAVPGSTYTLY